MDGLIVIDKPAGPTSHDVVACIRRAFGERRIGHTGTLDPAATGVLPLVLGRATRLARFLSSNDKSYQAVIRLGVATDTYDAQGTPTTIAQGRPMPPRADIESALDSFRGSFLQRPPLYSAKKIKGTRAYMLARAKSRGLVEDVATAEDDAPKPAMVTIRRLELLDAREDTLTIALDCSAGFYVRSLAHDVGERLGIGAHLSGLRRTRSGAFGLDVAVPLALAERDPGTAARAIVPLSSLLPELPARVVTTEGARRAGNGCNLGPEDFAWPGGVPDAPCVRLMNLEGELLGIGEPSKERGFLHPCVVLR